MIKNDIKPPLLRSNTSPLPSGGDYAAFAFKSMRILVIDDDVFVRETLSSMLGMCTYYEVTMVDSGSMGMKVLEENPQKFDLILVDVKMPGISGMDFVQKIRQNHEFRGVPIVMMSGIESRDEIAKYLANGADSYLLKPLAMQEIKILWTQVFSRQRIINLERMVTEQLRERLRLESEVADLKTQLRKLTRRARKDRVYYNRAVMVERYNNHHHHEHIVPPPPPLFHDFVNGKEIIPRMKWFSNGVRSLFDSKQQEYETGVNDIDPCITVPANEGLLALLKTNRFVNAQNNNEEPVPHSSLPLENHHHHHHRDVCRLCGMYHHDLGSHTSICINDQILFGMLFNMRRDLLHPHDQLLHISTINTSSCTLVSTVDHMRLNVLVPSIAEFVAKKTVMLDDMTQLYNVCVNANESVLNKMIAGDECMCCNDEYKMKEKHISYVARVKQYVRSCISILTQSMKYITENNHCCNDEFPLAKHPTTSAWNCDTILDDMQVLKPITTGAFGHVYLCCRESTKELFAVKILRGTKHMTKQMKERDIMLLCNSSSFIATLFYTFAYNDHFYIIMEYANGGDCVSLLHTVGYLREKQAQRYCAELVMALKHIHSMGIVHRDVKPDNILIREDGHILLTDFGLARLGLTEITLSIPDIINDDDANGVSVVPQNWRRFSHVGTMDYAAPEILLGSSYGIEADWWSFGCVMYELLVGHPPFARFDRQLTYQAILKREIHWPIDMSDDARDLLTSLLQVNRFDRLGRHGANDVMKHAFFKDIDWNSLHSTELNMRPTIKDPRDTSYFHMRNVLLQNGIDYNDEPYDNVTLRTLNVDIKNNHHSNDSDNDGYRAFDPLSSSVNSVEYDQCYFVNIPELAKLNKHS